MIILKTASAALFSIIALFILTRLTGSKQISQMNMFDYINGISIGSIAAEMATEDIKNWYVPLTAMTVYALCAIIIHVVSQKSIKARRMLNNSALMLKSKEKLYYENFKKSRLDINEFLTQCRVNGYFDINDIEAAFIEPNGQISIMPKSDKKPLCAKDASLQVLEKKPPAAVVLDGKILKENLKSTGNNEKWLDGELKKLKIHGTSNIFAAFCDSDNVLTVFEKISEAPQNDIIQ